VAAYLRVSSAGQDAQSQRAALERAAAARGDQIGEWYSEKQSGRALAPRERARRRGAVPPGRVRRLYVFRLDRLTRTGIRDTLALLDEFKAGGCRVTTIADGFDVDGPAADVVCSVLAWVAEMERAALLERMAAARARVEASGGRWGRPRRMTDAEVAKMVAAAPGATVRELAQRFKVPRSTVQRALKRK
jgi:DNA invertase Pin-like site-specific DNA recombinase